MVDQRQDRNGDGKITRREFDLPVSKDVGGLVPADLSAGGSMDEAFDSYDRNHGGVIDQTEQKEGVGPEASHPADRFSPGWNLRMSTQKRSPTLRPSTRTMRVWSRMGSEHLTQRVGTAVAD